MSVTKKLVIILISISLAFLASITALVSVLVDSPNSFSTDFELNFMAHTVTIGYNVENVSGLYNSSDYVT